MSSGRGFLLDANSLLLLIRSDIEARSVKSRVIQDSKILDLTTYEAGNGIWKESELLKTLSPEETNKLAVDVSLVISSLEKTYVEPSEFSLVLRIAKSERRTFYDSSYIYVAKRDNMTLITEDQTLSKIARKHVQTTTIREVLTKMKT
ncbi:MAG: type II toxin-antitoxin system VapC family toxin [Nitrososphaerales archaeon]